jgi:hypothetical protein
MSDWQFKQWFVGLVDGEGNFHIAALNKAKGYFSMRLRIRLHIDDLSVLNYIKGRLGVGSIEISDNSATLVFILTM